MRDTDDWPSCELCEHEKLRWQLEIKNMKNGNSTLVGSTCIKKFAIPISSGCEVLLYGTFRNKILDSKIATLQEKYNTARIRTALTTLAKKDMAFRERILHIIDYWEEEKSLTPLMACLIVSRCHIQDVTLGDAEIAINIQSLDNRIEILHMDVSQFQTILPFLKKIKSRDAWRLERDSIETRYLPIPNRAHYSR